MTVEAITDREGKQASTATEKEETLRWESFHPTNKYLYHVLHPAGSAQTPITEQAVERALYSQSVKKAPGSEKLSFDTIRRLWKWDIKIIVVRTTVAMCTGRHQAVWKRACGVVIRKPGKDDYSKLQAYRSISLLS
jgi:hypothetical protein